MSDKPKYEGKHRDPFGDRHHDGDLPQKWNIPPSEAKKRLEAEQSDKRKRKS